MSDLFKAVQESLRTYKQRGVDLTNPRGAVVFDKHYPAIEKGLSFRETESGDIAKTFQAHHILPLESGLIVRGWAAVGPNGTSLDHYLKKPFIDASEPSPWGRYGWFIHKGQHLHDVNDANGIYFRPSERQALHDSMKEWSLEPTHGWYKHNESHTSMSPEEHKEHQKNVRSGYITHPSKVTIAILRRANNNVYHGFDNYQYDIDTESLTPWSWKDKYPDDEDGPEW